MKILLDESLPRRLKAHFKDFKTKTVPEAGWQGKKNGELLKLMQEEFDVFITADQNLQYQLNLRNTTILIIIIKASSNRYEDLCKLAPKIIKYIKADPEKKLKIIS